MSNKKKVQCFIDGFNLYHAIDDLKDHLERELKKHKVKLPNSVEEEVHIILPNNLIVSIMHVLQATQAQ